MSNRAPADRLADLREQLRVLKAEEAALREGFIAGTLPPDGDEYVVTVERKEHIRIDGNAMRQDVEESIWRPYLVTRSSDYVTLKRKTLARIK
jgi:hypothetical protein